MKKVTVQNNIYKGYCYSNDQKEYIHFYELFYIALLNNNMKGRNGMNYTNEILNSISRVIPEREKLKINLDLKTGIMTIDLKNEK